MFIVGIDCRFAGGNSGLGRYTRELVFSLLQRQDQIRYVLFVQSAGEAWLQGITHARIVPFAAPHYSVREQLLFPRVIKKAGINLLLVPHFNVALFCPVPFVVTIHDLILHRHPGGVSLFKQVAYRFLMRHAVSASSAIISVSDFTKKELATVYGAHVLQKIVTVYEGVSETFHRRPMNEQRDVRLVHKLPDRFFLYVGSNKEHKQVPLLLEAFAKASPHGRSLVLVTCGAESEAWGKQLGVQVLRHVSDTDLPALYSSAEAFVTASVYEGFGLPIVEAEACTCPVIAFRCTSIPEVASPTALLLEPSADALAEALSREAFEKPTPKQWSWNETAELTVNVLMQTRLT